MANTERFLNSSAITRFLAPLRNLWTIQHNAGPAMISLGTGQPNPDCFPFESITVRTKTGKSFVLEGAELNTALGYTASPGLPELVQWLTEFQRRVHDPPYARNNPNLNELIITPGCQDGQTRIFEAILEPGDPVLVTEVVYPEVLAILRPLNIKFLQLESDEDGIKPDSLRKILTEQKNLGKRVKLLLTVPHHANPTGITISLERRKEIYKIACEFDLLIVEDDPYYYLTFDNNYSPLPTFLSLDTEGRVLRIDSFAKVIAAGLRIGVLTGPKAIIQKIMMHIAASSIHASTLAQSILHRFLVEIGPNGFLEHAKSVAQFYERRCNIMLKAAENHLTGLADWNRPKGGMFLWLKIHGVNDTNKMINEKGLKKNVLLAPGSYFVVDDSKPTSFLRAAFSWASEQQLEEGFRRLAEMIREEKREIEP